MRITNVMAVETIIIYTLISFLFIFNLFRRWDNLFSLIPELSL